MYFLVRPMRRMLPHFLLLLLILSQLVSELFSSCLFKALWINLHSNDLLLEYCSLFCVTPQGI
jgi:hypothetical protein